MKNKRIWNNSEMRSLTRGEAMRYFSTGQHYYRDQDWYIWFLGNATRYAIFQTFLWKYGNGEMVSYTDLTEQRKLDLKDSRLIQLKQQLEKALVSAILRLLNPKKIEELQCIPLMSLSCRK